MENLLQNAIIMFTVFNYLKLTISIFVPSYSLIDEEKIILKLENLYEE